MIPQREVSRSACHRCSTIRLANRRPKMKPYDARLTAFTPKLVTVLGEGYTFDRLRRDSIAGLTVAIEIGRAACRERVCRYGLILGVRGSLKKKQIHNSVTTYM